MTYEDFIEDSYQAIRQEAPPMTQLGQLDPWVRAIGELLLRMPADLQASWIDQYAALIVIKYPTITPDIALMCIRHGLAAAQAQWPKAVAR